MPKQSITHAGQMKSESNIAVLFMLGGNGVKVGLINSFVRGSTYLAGLIESIGKESMQI